MLHTGLKVCAIPVGDVVRTICRAEKHYAHQKAYAEVTPRPRATERSSQSLFLSLPVIGAIGMFARK
jgi:hypothetical protein